MENHDPRGEKIPILVPGEEDLDQRVHRVPEIFFSR